MAEKRITPQEESEQESSTSPMVEVMFNKLMQDNNVNPLERMNNLKFAQNLGVKNQHFLCQIFCLKLTRHIGTLYSLVPTMSFVQPMVRKHICETLFVSLS